jgi:hypothetical protein
LQKRAENHHCNTKDLKGLLTKMLKRMLTMSRSKKSEPGRKLRNRQKTEKYVAVKKTDKEGKNER